MKPVNEMSVEEVRDGIAEAQGQRWRVIEVGPYIGDMAWHRPDGQWSREHPVGDSLDSAAACLPEGWVITKISQIQNMDAETFNWVAYAQENRFGADLPIGERAPTELEARFRLALACIRASRQEEKTNASRPC